MRYIKGLFLTVMLLFSGHLMAQYHIGPKVSAMATYPLRYSDEYLLDINSRINYGYSAGLSFTYDVTELVQVNIDAMYSNKGRTLKGGFADEFKHVSRYTFIETPVNFRYRIKRDKYDLFVLGGGYLSYWLGGQGEIFSFEYDEAGIESFVYNIKKGSETSIENTRMTLSNHNDLQVGLEIGMGAIFRINQKQTATVEIKYQHGHSWLGEDEGIDVGLIEYYEDFRSTISSLSLSGSFQIGRKIGEGRKGKTNYGRKRIKR